MNSWIDYLYRWHVIAVHFPIAMLVTAAVFELWAIVRRSKAPPSAAFAMVCVGAVGAMLAAWLGWELSSRTKHPDMEQVLKLHRWGGVAAAALAMLSVVAGIGAVRVPHLPKFRWPFRVFVFMTAAVIVLTAHWGGELIYGEDYFFPGGSPEQIDKDE